MQQHPSGVIEMLGTAQNILKLLGNAYAPGYLKMFSCFHKLCGDEKSARKKCQPRGGKESS
jgi:hypothetical protein